MAAQFAGQPVLILREGTSRASGREAQHASIAAARIVAESVKSCLGPKGMDKMLVDSFGDVTITNDGATILDEMDVQHPSAKMLVEVAKTQDDEVGDGTTTAVVLTGELLGKAEQLIDKDIHPTVIADGYRIAAEKALEILEDIAIKVDPVDKSMLKKVATVAVATKMLAEYKDGVSDIAVRSVLEVAEKDGKGYKVDIDDIKVEKKPGGSLSDTKLIQGVLLDKEVVHPGMPRRVENAKIALISRPLEVEKTEFDAKLNIKNPEQMKAFLDEEEKMLKEMVDKIVSAGANVAICEKGIDDVVQHFLAKKGVLAVRRVKQSDMEKLVKATGAHVVTNIEDFSSKDLGAAQLVEERKVADDKMTFVEGCKNPKAVTILVRGGTERIVDEAERVVHDALCVVRDVVVNPKVVAGGGAPEAEVAKRLRVYADKLAGREQLAVRAFAEALESVPMVLAENAGLDPIDIQVELRTKHDQKIVWAGVDPFKGKVADMSKQDVYEPLAVKIQLVKSASEAAAMILKVDDVISASKKEMKGPPKGPEDSGEEAGEY
ncbi:TCP-1/cpn60 chaperonin family protein [Candidatus Bathyarchaeota archaeon]|nr:TCP-1/cpn60 chaperonin family protein [Candidatus Bathyarchaeota archaeon]